MALAAKAQTYHFSVQGMRCGQCLRKIQSIGRQFSQLSNLQVDLGKGLVQAEWETGESPDPFMMAVKKEGFAIRLLADDNLPSKNTEAHAQLIRVGIAAAASSNLMILGIASYVGADQSEFATLFHWLSFALYLPVGLYCAFPIYQKSWNALRHRRASVDLPLSVALIGTATISTVNLLRGSDEIYFDSLSMFVFLLLASRLFIFKLQNRYIQPVSLKDVMNQPTVMCWRQDKWQSLPSKQLVLGDRIVLTAQEYSPVDGELLSEVTEWNRAIFSGEALPVELKKHGMVFAGTQLISPKAEIKVAKTSEQSRLATLINQLNATFVKNNEGNALVDRGAHIISLLILSTAVVFFAIYAFIDWREGLVRMVSLLVVACPCALAIAVPLVHSLSLRKSLQNGILFKSAQALETLCQCDCVVFDKTGTLTKGSLDLQAWFPRDPSDLEKAIIHRLEQNSEHPIAKALLRAVDSIAPQSMTGLQERAGSGVSGVFNNNLYEIRKGPSDRLPMVTLLCDGVPLVNAILSDSPVAESKSVIEALQESGLECILLTGDREEIANTLGASLGFPKNNIHANQTPEQKAVFVQALKQQGRRVLYLGDGINDALAMKAASVAISMTASAETAFKSSDVHILEGGLLKLRAMFFTSARAVSTLRILIGMAIAYNLTFAGMALAGFINPMVAVLLMPISSLSLVIVAFLRIQKREAQ